MNDRSRADAVYAALLERQGERWVQPRVERTRRVLELLDDPQRTYRVVHVTGTNGKTSTSRIIESLLRAHGLRTGLFTSPHLERFTERIMIDGEPIADAAVADAWDEIAPFVDLVDAELAAAGDAPLTFFELLTVLAFVAFADAPIDVLVLEVGMGGSWDSTNTADGDVAVFAPIDIDHADRLGDTIARDRRREGRDHQGRRRRRLGAAGSRSRAPCCARRPPRRDATIAFEGAEFALTDAAPRRRRAAHLGARPRGRLRRRVPAALRRRTRAQNAALAIAAVESLIGGGSQPIAGDILAEGLGAGDARPADCSSSASTRRCSWMPRTTRTARARSPRRCASRSTSTSGASCSACSPTRTPPASSRSSHRVAAHVFATAPDSERASDADRIADLAEAHGLPVTVHADVADAAESARAWAAASDRRAVVIAGSVVLAGEALALAAAEDWKAGWERVTRSRCRDAPRPRRSRGAAESLGVDRARLRVDRRLPRRARDLRAQGAARADPAVVGHRRRFGARRSSCC